MAYTDDDFLEIDVGEAYANGWQQLKENFLMLLLISIVSFVISAAFGTFSAASSLGVVGAIAGGFSSFAYGILIIGLLAIPIFIAGLICFGVGVIVSVMWTRLAFASLYHAISDEWEEGERQDTQHAQ